jgi:hypothetical protein
VPANCGSRMNGADRPLLSNGTAGIDISPLKLENPSHHGHVGWGSVRL